MHKLLQFDQGGRQNKKLNRKKFITITVCVVILIIFIVTSLAYSSSKPFRQFMDKYIFRKNISDEKVTSIPLDYESNVNVFVYNKYICVLADSMLREYNASGNLTSETKLEISNPVYSINNKYLAISEKDSNKIYLIEGSKILWQQEVDGNITKLDVNKNGYITAILTGTTYKSVIATFDNKGNELFKTYLSNTTAMDATISRDNKHLAFAEINTTGTFIQSNVKIISIESAKDTPSDAIIYTYEAPSDNLITNIAYSSKNKLVCALDNKIIVLKDEQEETLMELEEKDKNINMADIELEDNIYRAIEKSTGLFTADTMIEIMNIDSKKQTVYTSEGVAKSINCYNNTIAINLGQEVEFVNTSGWLMKRYSSSQDIQNIIIGNDLAGIVYEDRVEIINL